MYFSFYNALTYALTFQDRRGATERRVGGILEIPRFARGRVLGRFSVRVRAAGGQRRSAREIADFDRRRLCERGDIRRQRGVKFPKLSSIVVHAGLADRSRHRDRERVWQRTSEQESAAQNGAGGVVVRGDARARSEDAVVRGHRGREQAAGQRGTVRATLPRHRRVSERAHFSRSPKARARTRSFESKLCAFLT